MRMEEKGLSSAQAALLLAQHGYNEIVKKDASPLRRFVMKFIGPIPLMIAFAAALSAILRHWEDFVIIMLLLAVNIGVEFYQESKASNALVALRDKLAKKALVLRDGYYREIDARMLVPGDIIKLRIGSIVPADASVLDTDGLDVDQSAITGESLPAHKKTGDAVYSNSIIKIGEATARVSATGMQTHMGSSAALVQQAVATEQSHFQKAILRIGHFLIMFSLMLTVVILIVSVVRHVPLLETLDFLLVLAIASVPVALPAVLSVTMAISAYAIARKNAVVRNVSAIEELAGVDVVCSDKTGTLTQNKLIVGTPIVYGDFTEKDVLLYSILTSHDENNDPIEEPLFAYFKEHFTQEDLAPYMVEDTDPFDPIQKKSTARVRYDGQLLNIVKGAPQIIIDMVAAPDERAQAQRDVDLFARKGYRTLAVALKRHGEEYRLVGIIPFFDALREDSAAVVKQLHEEGVRVTMLTGDHGAIATETARNVGLGTNIISAQQLRSAQHADDTILEADGFSEVVPEDKYKVVETFQKHGHIVAMTGDGVNDAPALQKADIGIAVAGATDAARAAADLVLLAPGLSVINDALRLARMAFRRMMAYATFRIAETVRIILFITLAILIFDTYPVTAIMIVLLALLNDIPVMMIGYDNAPVDGHPVRWHMREVLTVATVLGVMGVVSSFGLFAYLLLHGYPEALIQTLLFLKFDVAGHSTLYLTRTGRHHFWHRPFPSLAFFLPTFSTRIIGTLIAVYGVFMTPIGWGYAALIWLYATAWWILNDFVKVWTYKILDYTANKKQSQQNTPHNAIAKT